MRWSCRSAVPLVVGLPRRSHRLAIRCRSCLRYGAIHDGTAAGVLAFPSVPTIRDHRALSVGGIFEFGHCEVQFVESVNDSWSDVEFTEL